MSGAFDFDPQRFSKRQAQAAPVVPLRTMPLEWEHGLKLLADRVLPRGAAPERWAQIVSDATRVATRYHDTALASGWDLANLFGYDPEQPDAFVGLAVRLRGRTLVDIAADQAIIKVSGGYLYHRPFMPAASPLLWNFKEVREPS